MTGVLQGEGNFNTEESYVTAGADWGDAGPQAQGLPELSEAGEVDPSLESRGSVVLPHLAL